MIRSRIAIGCALVALAAAPLAAQELSPEGQKAMEAYTKLMATNEHHEFLANFAGDWRVTNTAWMQPGAPPMASESAAHGEIVLGGRFLVLQHDGVMFGQPFEGIQIVGYDNMQKKYVSFWIDNTGTGFYLTSGTREAGSSAIRDAGAWPDPGTGGITNVRAVTTLVSPDEFTYELFMVGADGSEFKSLENRAVRAR
jgi:hypothetical protein